MSVRTHMREREYPGVLASPEHGGACSGAADALPQETRGERNRTKPHPSRPPKRRPPRKLTPASEYAQLGWIRDRLPALRSARHSTTADMRRPPPGLASRSEGLTTEEERLPDGH